MTADLRSKLDRMLAEYEHAERQVKDERAALKRAKARLKHCLQAQKTVQAVAEGVQASAHAQVAGVVTKCLKAVFGEEDGYTFDIRFQQKRGKTEAGLVFVREGVSVDPLSASGGGAVDVASFALRLACLVLSRPARRRLLVLDEPWKHLSAQYRPALRALVLELAETMGVQFLVVTHADTFRMGRVVEIE